MTTKESIYYLKVILLLLFHLELYEVGLLINEISKQVIILLCHFSVAKVIKGHKPRFVPPVRNDSNLHILSIFTVSMCVCVCVCVRVCVCV